MPEKCLYWPKEKCLLISDVHLGKIDHFRKNGFPLPPDASKSNYLKINGLISAYSPERILFLGDLFHSTLNQDWFQFEEFVRTHPSTSFELIKGNHDILDKQLFENVFDAIYEEELSMGPFRFTHDILPSIDHYNICGHIHPSIRINGMGLQSVRLPCFYFTQEYAILPAFGVFTGTYTIHPNKTASVYIVADNEVIQYS